MSKATDYAENTRKYVQSIPGKFIRRELSASVTETAQCAISIGLAHIDLDFNDVWALRNWIDEYFGVDKD